MKRYIPILSCLVLAGTITFAQTGGTGAGAGAGTGSGAGTSGSPSGTRPGVGGTGTGSSTTTSGSRVGTAGSSTSGNVDASGRDTVNPNGANVGVSGNASSGIILNDPSGSAANLTSAPPSATNIFRSNDTNLINDPSGAFRTNRLGTNGFSTNGFELTPPITPLPRTNQ